MDSPTQEERRGSGSCNYVLMTAAYNEEAYIEKTIQSVLAQTLRPVRWVIVSDNSQDRTDEIIQSYTKKYDFIWFLRVNKPAGHSFVSKVVALRKGAPLLDGVSYEFIGNLDADLSLDPDYYQQLIDHFQQNPDLGLAGGFVYEDHGDGFQSRWFNSVSNVAHAAQLVRRKCYDSIGGYAVLRYGGEDWYAQTSARMKGWKVEGVPTLKIFHHRLTGGGSTPLKNAFRLGKLDYSLGSDPIFEMVKCLRRYHEKPYLMASLTRLAGFAWPYVSREPRAVPAEFAAFLRNEQRSRMASMFSLRRWFNPRPRPKTA